PRPPRNLGGSGAEVGSSAGNAPGCAAEFPGPPRPGALGKAAQAPRTGSLVARLHSARARLAGRFFGDEHPHHAAIVRPRRPVPASVRSRNPPPTLGRARFESICRRRLIQVGVRKARDEMDSTKRTQPSRETLELARTGVRNLLQGTASFCALPAQDRQKIASNMVDLVAYLAEPEGIKGTTLASFRPPSEQGKMPPSKDPYAFALAGAAADKTGGSSADGKFTA